MNWKAIAVRNAIGIWQSKQSVGQLNPPERELIAAVQNDLSFGIMLLCTITSQYDSCYVNDQEWVFFEGTP